MSGPVGNPKARSCPFSIFCCFSGLTVVRMFPSLSCCQNDHIPNLHPRASIPKAHRWPVLGQAFFSGGVCVCVWGGYC